jgi:hypothetical protein
MEIPQTRNVIIGLKTKPPEFLYLEVDNAFENKLEIANYFHSGN